MAENIFYMLVFVIGALTIACLFVTVPPSRKALRSGQPITAPLLSDRSRHTLYVLLGLQACVMLLQAIFGFAAGISFGNILLVLFVLDPSIPVPYGAHTIIFLYLHQTRKAKKQMAENSGDEENYHKLP